LHTILTIKFNHFLRFGVKLRQRKAIAPDMAVYYGDVLSVVLREQVRIV
jgi:hypothetical protein